MKNVYCLLLVLMLPMAISAQNYAPFPYDSVFFESSIPNSDMMPVVKVAPNSNVLQDINPVPSLAIVTADAQFDAVQVYSASKQWLGIQVLNEDSLYFKSNFKKLNVIDDLDTIFIDLKANLNDKDTFNFVDHLYHPDDTMYVEISYDSLIESLEDTIKEYSFQILDSSYAPINLFTYYMYYLDTTIYNLNNIVFQISKHNGILKSPDLAFFPYCKQYSLKGSIKDLLDLSTSHFDKVFKMDVGDEIHTRKYNSSMGNNTWNRYAKKRICIQQVYDSIEQTYITNFDVWERYDKAVYNFQNNTSDSTFVYSSFEQIIDIVNESDFDNLNQMVPTGMEFNYSSWANRGYFLQSNLKTLMYYEVYMHLHYADTIHIWGLYDGGQYQKHYNFGEGIEYFDHTDVWGANYYKPVYVSTSDTTWGTPYSDDFLDIVENSTVEVEFFIQENKIILPANHEYQDFRIYDITGKLMDYYPSSSISEAIDISKYKHGTYILIGYDGKSAKHFKFVKH